MAKDANGVSRLRIMEGSTFFSRASSLDWANTAQMMGSTEEV